MPQLTFKLRKWAKYEADKRTKLGRPHHVVKTPGGRWVIVMGAKPKR
jgi:hypothetical protein